MNSMARCTSMYFKDASICKSSELDLYLGTAYTFNHSVQRLHQDVLSDEDHNLQQPRNLHTNFCSFDEPGESKPLLLRDSECCP